MGQVPARARPNRLLGYRAAEAGREVALKGVTPSKVAAETARTTVSEPLYKEASEAVVTIDPQLKSILGRLPEGTIEAARKLAKLEGRPFTFGEAVPSAEMATRVGGTPQITGESLHWADLRLSIEDLFDYVDSSNCS